MKTIKRLTFLMLLAILSLGISAQNRMPKPILSPEISADSKITFRVFAPEAKKVTINGNWMAGWGAQVEMMRNDTGLYQLTIDVLPSEMYTYSYFVDGVKTIDPNNAMVVRDGTRNESMFMVPGEKATMYGVNDVPHGTLQKVWYASPTLGMTRLMYVYTPAGYNESKEKLPVFYLLHGGGGDEDAWTTLGRAPQILDNLIASGKAKPMIVVMTNGNPGDAAAPGAAPAKKEAKGQNNPGGMGSGKFEESLVKDVIPYIEKNYRVIANKDNRAVSGLSMGGMQTLYLSNNHPETFSYFGVMSMGLVDMSRFGGKNDPAERVNGLEKLKASHPKLYWIGVGKDDFLYQSAQDLRKFLDDNKFTYEYRESEGGHTWTNWRIYLSELAPKLFK
jgi:enterochelin esterase family protein